MSGEWLHFAAPAMANLLWAWLALLGLLVWLDLRGSDALESLVGRALQDRLVTRPAPWRRRLRLALIGLAGVCMILALMRPQYGLRYVSTPRVGAEIMIALDVSKSMLADDAAPSRLERAKAEIADLISYLGDDHVGLIAFAGRASVLSPMTPDKSFLRLVLDGAGPHSVTRGGTRLEEPIRRAVAGFGAPGPAQRALILITDGEDHDSFALDAAKEAAEAGVKIIAIGFGDEAGSEISVTDPRTGARTRLRDGDGRPIISRLDGQLLRELALATDGAYVPAGTGVLDLASIYEEHIARLTRGQLDERGRTVRDEVYPWFVLLALVFLTTAAAVTATRSVGEGAGPTESANTAGGSATGAASTLAAVLAATLLLGLGAHPAGAQPAAPSDPEPLAIEDLVQDLEEDAKPHRAAAEEQPTPREQYNAALESLAAGEPEAAAASLRRARRDAGDDFELRYRATYNLGVAGVENAELLEASSPRDALAALYEAADWFRDAVGQQPDDQDARHNLDVTLRLALVLADFLARQEQGDLAAELDALGETQRKRVVESATLLEQVARTGALDAAEQLRTAFRSAATEQRTLLADTDALTERIAEERDALESVPEEERSPEDAMRNAQLSGVLHYLDRARERMGQTRRQLRQRRAERAYRRASAALAELKRARDQLRTPVEQLDVLIGEVDRVAMSSAALATRGRVLPGTGEPLALPAFLTAESAEQEHTSVRERVGELAAGFEAGVERADAAAARPVDDAAPQMPPEQMAFLESVREALPHVRAANMALDLGGDALTSGEFGEAHGRQRAAQAALAEARERFFDLRQLIEATWTDEERIAAIATSDEEAPGEAAAPSPAALRDEYAPALRALQDKNLERGERVDDLIAEALRSLEDLAAAQEAADPNAPPLQVAPGAPQPPSPEQIAAESERMTLAAGLTTQALAGMDAARRALGEDADDPDWSDTARSAATATAHLETLRTLFFSIVEHVREVARKQVDLADATQDAVALGAADTSTNAEPSPMDDDAGTGSSSVPPAAAAKAPARSEATRARAEPLGLRQRALSERSGQIGDALAEQAEAAAGQSAAPAQPGAASAAGEDDTPLRLRKAAEHVVSAQLAMADAAEVIRDDSAALSPARDHQDAALEELRLALAQLEPPPPPEQQEQQDQQQEQEQEQQDGEGEDEPEESETEQDADPQQLLQAVRDREAERRREREERRSSARSEPVDKDW